MRLSDLIRVSLVNLLRHRIRTMLTILGVVVGCTSVVVMISIGFGMQEAQEIMLRQMGELTQIQVMNTQGNNAKNKLNKAMINRIKKIKKVSDVIPEIKADYDGAEILAGNDGRYRSMYTSILGVDLKKLDKLGITLESGDAAKCKKNDVIIAKFFAYAFYDTKRMEPNNSIDYYGKLYNEEGQFDPENADLPKPYFDPKKTKMSVVYESEKEENKKVSTEITVGGIIKPSFSRGDISIDGIIMNIDELERLKNKQAVMNGTKSQTQKGYDQAVVIVEDIRDVEDVETQIHKLGFSTNSMESIRKPLEEQARQKQMMLGGLGAISLFVAALGITNTMIMSISERTREIGVMKSLGCFVHDVRKIFLLEAGYIGLFGGLLGVALSYFISFLMNTFAEGEGAASGAADSMGIYLQAGSEVAVRISVIPWWLAVFAVVFSVVIGIGAGYYPANKAVSIPALEAIKHD